MKLIIAVMYSDLKVYSDCKEELIDLFGEIEKEGEEYDFDKFTKFYEKEMGKGLIKRFIVFKDPIIKNSIKEKQKIKDFPISKLKNFENLKKIKIKTAEIEKKYSKEGKRTINLDPGYLSSSELALASFKKGTNYKEDIGGGVYLHKVLEFKDGKIIEFWHTFPDYREKKEFFLNYC